MTEVREKPVTISALEFENVKRIKAVRLEPDETGLTVIGGRNAQGKTSVLDAICWALGGDKYRPDQPHRDGSASDPSLHVELSNGIVVERKGKSGALKVTDPSGAKGGQALVNSFVGQFALDVPRFLQANDKEKAQTLLRIIGVEDELNELDRREAALVQKRLTTGQVERQRRGAVETMPHYPDAPEVGVDVADLAEQQREALELNASNQRRRDALSRLEADADRLQREIEDLNARAQSKGAELLACVEKARVEREAVASLVDADTSGMAEAMEQAQNLNAMVAANNAYICALAEADQCKQEYDELDRQVQAVRDERMALLKGVRMPLDGLTVEDGLLVYNGHVWGDMSGSEQMRVATAIVRRVNPACGFVLVDKLEQMDPVTLSEFGAWCDAEGLQVIGTRVSTGGECSVIIEDGFVVDPAEGRPEPFAAMAPMEGRAF